MYNCLIVHIYLLSNFFSDTNAEGTKEAINQLFRLKI